MRRPSGGSAHGERKGRGGTGGVAALAGALVLLSPAAAPAAAVELTLHGAPRHSVAVCGRRQPAVLVRSAGRRVAAHVRGRATGVSVQRCEAGRWARARAVRVRRGRAVLSTRRPGDFRVRATRRGRSVSRAAHLRVLAPRPSGEAPPRAGVVALPVAFRVVNQNRSRTPCATDGRPYEVRGRLVAPRSVLERGEPPSVTVYLHDIGWGAYYWHFTAIPEYDYATEMARAGHASVVYDQLGYGASGRPAPDRLCYGGQADVASQVVAKLRTGDFEVAGERAPRFRRVALASHSIHGLTSQPEAYSFRDVDALVVTSWADQGFSQRLQDATRDTQASCARGGDPPGHASFGAEAFKALYFANAEPRVADAAAARRTPVPCGEPQSAFQVVAADQALLREVAVPVLLVYGRQDALFDQPSAGQQQRALYSGSRDVQLTFLDGAGQAHALERTAPAFRATMSSWLAARGF